MKKFLSLFMALLILCSLVIPTASAYGNPQYETADGFVYSVSDGTVTIEGYNSEESNVVIPAEIEGKPVSVIGYRAFYEKTYITDVQIPDTVTFIDDDAFYKCTSLKETNLPANLKRLGIEAFACTALESVAIPATLEKVDNEVSDGYYYYNGVGYYLRKGPFSGCENLRTVTFEEGTTTILKNIMAGCVGLQEIIIPDTVTSIGKRSFQSCLSLESVEIPENITFVDESAFSGCQSLVSVDFKGTDTELGEGVFSGCGSLKNVNLPANLKSLSISTFSGCDALETIELPEGLVSIGWRVFAGCESLKNIEIPESVTEILNFAFYNCSVLEKISIPESVKTLGKSVFENCESLSEVQFADNSVTEIPVECFKNCFELQTITLPQGLLEIREKAFAGDYKLKDVIIPESVTFVAENAFALDNAASEDEAEKFTVEIADTYEVKFIWKAVPDSACYTLNVTGRETGEVLNITTKETVCYWDKEHYEDYIYSATVIAYDSQGKVLDRTDCIEFSVIMAGVYDWYGTFGDVRGDGDVDIRDATHIQRYLAGLVSFSRFVQKNYADVDKDEKVTIKDVTEIQKYCAGLEVASEDLGKEIGGGGTIWEVKYFYEE